MDITVPEGTTGRLDVFLARRTGVSRRRVREWIRSGAVTVNDARTAKGRGVQPGDRIRVADETVAGTGLTPEPTLAATLLWEDAEVVAALKPAGMPTHARRPTDHGTLANFLIAQHPELHAVGRVGLEAGVVHRLDTGTSGIVLAARTPRAYARLRQLFRAQRVEKEYHALVAGDVSAPGTINAPIAHAPRSAKRMRACLDPDAARTLRARPASTSYRPLERFGSATLVAVRIRSGVRHQIRVHLAAAGHPLIGDPLYARARSLGDAPPGRLLLHASRVAFPHPVTGATIALEAPLPPDFVAALEALRRSARGLV
jgi:23S rRNA pseudouridine1911/1915/1917 synthase